MVYPIICNTFAKKMISKATNNILFRVIKYLLELNLWSNTTRHQAEDSCKNNIKLIDFVEQYAAARQVEGRKNYTGRSGSVRSLIKHLKALGAEDTLLVEVDLDFCQQFVTYLRSAQDMHHHLKTPKKLAESTILSKIKIFSAVLNEAVRFRLLEENPMGLLHTIHHTARVQKERAFLSQSEIKKVMKAPCAYPLLKEAFSLSILTGLRKSDIFSLKAADLIKRDGIYYIKKTCVKTQQELIIPLSDEAEACLERSTGCRLAELDREKETPLFSALPSSRLNEKLRTWLKEAGITDKHITFHGYPTYLCHPGTCHGSRYLYRIATTGPYPHQHHPGICSLPAAEKAGSHPADCRYGGIKKRIIANIVTRTSRKTTRVYMPR